MTKASAEGADDGKVAIKADSTAATNKARLEVQLDGTWTKWTALGTALSEDGMTASGLVPATYKARYAEDDANAESAEGEIVVDYEKLFAEFVSGELGDANIDTAQKFEGDGWVVSSAKYQVLDSSEPPQPVVLKTYDYVADSTGYSYSGRIKLQKEATFTIKTVADTILRIEAGSTNTSEARKIEITGADKTEWSPLGYSYSLWIKATDSTVVLKNTTSKEIAVYGIHIVDEELEPVELSSETTYSKPTVVLSKNSAEQNSDVTISATIPKASTKKTMSDGTVTTTESDVTAEVSYKVAPVTDGTVGDYATATVTDGKVSTSTIGTYSYTASYTIGETTYTSDAETLEVTKAFEAATKIIPLAAGTINETAYTAEDVPELNLDTVTGIEALTSDFLEATYTAADGDVPAYITLTSKKSTSGEKVTVTVNGTKDSESVTAALLAVVGTDGALTVTAKAYSALPDSVTVKLFTTPTSGTGTYNAAPTISAEGLVSKKADATWAYNSTIGAIASGCPKWGTSSNISGGYIEPASSVSYKPAKDEDVGYVTFTLTADVACKITKVSVKSGNGQSNDAYLGVFLNGASVATQSYSSKIATISEKAITASNTFVAGADIVVKVGMVSSKTQLSEKSNWAKIAISDLELTVEKQ
ncbi:MAG: hypothetical protein IJ158_02555 [Treponema sp.]|nr:hypothetical protein [Treponema sp.]